MKLHVFKASSNQKAISMVHKALGPDALIYNTRTVANGVEILAGPPVEEGETIIEVPDSDSVEQEEKQDQSIVMDSISTMKKQLEDLHESMGRIARQLNNNFLEKFHLNEDETGVQRHYLLHYLHKLGFRGNFCGRFAADFLHANRQRAELTETMIQSVLEESIKIAEMDDDDEPVVFALVGPTGVGKTTTVAKLANRYIARFGHESLGLVTTDFNDISGKNRLLNYSWQLDLPVEYADTPETLEQVLDSMMDKKLILIDTHGVSQRDAARVRQLHELIESQGSRIRVCIVLPCNVQEPVLDEIARGFNSPNLHSCILTKEDECITLATALGVCMNYNMRVSYICHGQDINHDIYPAKAERLLHQIISGSAHHRKAGGAMPDETSRAVPAEMLTQDLLTVLT